MLRYITNNGLHFLLAVLALGLSNAASAVEPTHHSLRVVTFNIYNRPWERGERIKTAIEALRRQDADIICLQEVATGWILPGDPVEEMARELHMYSSRFWHEENLGIFRTGIAVLSRLPIVSSEYHEFALHDFWDAKGYMRLELALPNGARLQLVNLHMASTSKSEVRRGEWHELAAFARGLQSHGPVLIAGDFNTEPSDPALQEFVRHSGAINLYEGWKNIDQMRTWTPDYRDSCGLNKDPASQLIDYMFILPGSPQSTGSLKFSGGKIVLPGRAPHPSDHCPVAAEIGLEGFR